MKLNELITPTYRPLRRPVPLRPGQTYWSYVSSLAARNGFSSVDHFREIFGMGRRYFEPSDDEIHRHAIMGGVDHAQLALTACRTVGDRLLSVSGQLVRRLLRPAGDRMRVCTACLAEDVAGLNGLEQDAAAYVRIESLIEVVTGCRRHGLAFIDPAVDATNLNDLSYHMRVRRIQGLPLPAIEHRPSDASNYFAGRMRGETGLTTPFLDDMPLTDAIDTCALLGGFALSKRGEHFIHHWSHNPLMEQYRQAGFEIASQGEHAVRRLLEAKVDASCAGQGLRNVYGTLARKLATSKLTVLGSLRSIVADVAIRNVLPFAVADKVLGLPMPPREYLTVAAAAKIFKVDERILDEVLVDRGTIDPKDARGSAVPIIKVEDHRELLTDLADYFNVYQVAKRLGVSRIAVLTITRLGFIAPCIVRQSKKATPIRHFRPREVDAFLESVLKQASVNTKPPEDYTRLETAAMRAGRGAEAVYRLAVERKLQTLVLTRPDGNFRDLRVDVNEVRSLVRMPTEFLNSRDAAAILGTCTEAARRMGIQGFLQSTLAANPVNTRRERSFRRADVEAFKATYVFLRELWAIGHSQKSVKRRLRDAGVKPAFPYAAVRMFIYRRDDIPPDLLAN